MMVDGIQGHRHARYPHARHLRDQRGWHPARGSALPVAGGPGRFRTGVARTGPPAGIPARRNAEPEECRPAGHQTIWEECTRRADHRTDRGKRQGECLASLSWPESLKSGVDQPPLCLKLSRRNEYRAAGSTATSITAGFPQVKAASMASPASVLDLARNPLAP